MYLRSILLALAAAAGAAAFAPAQAHAAALVLWPVDPTLADGQKATALWVENKGNAPVALQVRVLGWSQASGDDGYGSQDEVVASPPIATVPAGARQLVRIIRRSPAGDRPEQSYRLLVDELPPPVDPGQPSVPTARLDVRMRYSIPLFAYTGAAAVAAKPELRAHVELADGRRYLVIGNGGARHARLVDLRGVSGGRPATLIGGLVGYVLPGRTMRWALPADAGAASSFVVNVNGVDQLLAPAA